MIDYVLREVPVGIQTTGTRRERDSIGAIDVPADKYWGAVTQRALKAYPASTFGLPDRFYRSYGYVKRAAALTNGKAGDLPSWKTAAIARAADDLIAGLLADQFPLPIWQAGSGRDADTNVNEVLANRAVQLLGGAVGSREPVDPVRDVNKGQSLATTFTVSVYLATVIEIEDALMPRGSGLTRALDRRPRFSATHVTRLRAALVRLDEAEGSLHEIGFSPEHDHSVSETSEGHWKAIVAAIAADTARPLIVARGAFSERGSLDAMVAVMAAVRGLAVVLLDIADAVQAFEPATGPSSRYAQAEAVATVCLHVIGQDQMVTAAAWRGGACPRPMRPLIVTEVLNAVHDLADACDAMRRVVTRTR